jgi:hypothetical protein
MPNKYHTAKKIFLFNDEATSTYMLIHKIRLCQWQRLRRFCRTHHAIRLNRIPLGIDLHLRPDIVKLHIFLANLSAILDGLDALAQAVRFNHARGNGRLGYESDA